ncbi:hypothetical protein MMB232_01855 [Brevundimonas subvibrioides]|uniref:DUF192 domain-containing protein n=1 Tax=Brevundimonas subvibrioides (strain ATCC 15264 / DSM 4735 / LMG 14903 / NBRC 16000 / CB 81) TaxID=633149 RepID=D9QHW7_BRESC|nr:DUF192 domain-containing protein [Brevundimonas subvibrioides]ADL01225.1 protein of unknown function DUF192 [Brevundimonas subvibrioides ATCC 15264]
MLSKRLLTTIGLGLALLTGACAKEAGPVDAAGRPLEALTIVTASGEHQFLVEIADDEAERQRGLMFRPPLEDDRGMLFQFPVAEEQGFWMKNTPSSLDILYIDPTGRIVSIASHATPYSETTLPSNGAANGVLELRAGRAEEIGAVPGSTVRHPFFKP